MSATEPSLPRAWEPLTPRGVAAFAGASLKRLLLAQVVVAGLAAGTVVWFLEAAWFPVVRAGIHALPPQGEVKDEQLDWPGDTPARLAGNGFLGLTVDLTHSGQLAREAQLQVEFGRKNLRVYHMLGYEMLDYPAGWRIAFNRTELEPRWGAWEAALAAGAAAVTFIGLLAAWTVLASVYCLPVRLIALYGNRDLNWGQSWRLAGAALMPGAVFLVGGMVGYGLGLLDLVRLGGVAGLHLVIGWIYLGVSAAFLPRDPKAAGGGANPFDKKRN